MATELDPIVGAATFRLCVGDFLEVSGSGVVNVTRAGAQKRYRVRDVAQLIGPYANEADCTITAGATGTTYTVHRERETRGAQPVTFDTTSGQLIAGGVRVAGVVQWADAESVALVGADGIPRRPAGYLYTASRPYLCSFGDSLNGQDVPTVGEGGHSGIAPTLWANALCAGAFDYLQFSTTLSGSGGSQSSAQSFVNGMSGYSGGLVTDRGKYAIDNFLTEILTHTSGQPFVTLLISGINDLSNNDVSGYDATIWTDLRTIIEKVQQAGGLPLVKINEPSVNLTTHTKRRNRAALADTILTFAAGRADIAVMDIEAAWRQYGQGVTWERATRGATGDGVHPNLLGAIIHGFAARDALRGFVRFDPPWARSDFAATIVGTSALMTGTTGTEGTGADAAGEVPTGWTSNTYGTNTSIRCDQEVGPEGYGSRVVTVATGTPTSDTFGLSSGNPSVSVGSPVYRAWVDLDVRAADFVNALYFGVRATGSTFWYAGIVGASDERAMTAASGTAPMSPSGPKLLAGQRLVLSSMPFVFPASPQGSLYYVGGGGKLTDPAARSEAFVRFAGLISY